MNAYCNHAGIGIIPYSPLSDGHLARPIGTGQSTRLSVVKGSPFERHFTESDKTIINRVEELAKKKNVPMAQIALAWVQTKCTSPIVGINKVSSVPHASSRSGSS
jgi:aryl-alcohol dehydrogenase-like predicted oxidoreductase